MLNYFDTVKDFISENFNPSNPESANVKLNTEQFLELLFRIFPNDCISDYDLNDILIMLNYKRFAYVIESYSEVGDDDEKEYEIKRSLTVGWCFKTPLDLHTITVSEIKDRH